MKEFARWSEVFTGCTNCFVRDIPRLCTDIRNIQGGAEQESWYSSKWNEMEREHRRDLDFCPVQAVFSLRKWGRAGKKPYNWRGKQGVYAVFGCKVQYTAWLKKMDSISYVHISWTIHGMWMIYITFERGGSKFLKTAARAIA